MEQVTPRKVKETCCFSYLTAKGRCYSCPEYEFDENNEMKDPDAEEF